MYQTSYSNSSDAFAKALEQYNIPPEFIAFLGGFIVIFSFIVLALLITTYILGSIGMSKLAKSQDYENTWIAWIPIINKYLLGKLAFDNIAWGWGYLGFTLLTIFTKLPYEALLIFATSCMFNYFIFRRFSNKYVVLTILNILTFGIAGSFILFALRNNEEIVKE